MIEAAAGGVLIGLGAVWLLASIGRIAGISGIVATAVRASRENSWAIVFVAGLACGGFAALPFVDFEPVRSSSAITPLLITGGLLVGIGTRLGSGCTSGHGVCGIARFSLRSMVATVTFLITGMITATWVYG